MSLIRLLFAIIWATVPVNKTDFQRVQDEADEWENKLAVKYDDEKKGKDVPEEQKLKGIERMYAKYMETWPVKLVVAAAYIPLLNWARNIVSPYEDEDEHEDELR